MKYLYLPLSLIAFTFTGCDQENDLKLQKGTTTSQSIKESNSNNSMLQNLPNNNIPTNPVFSENQTTNSTSSSNVKLNPEHGQPGHRCEIPVGSPLNSDPIPTNNVSNNNIDINSTKTSAPVNLSKIDNSALNPEHGKPGHRCDIAVGAPLNSSPNTQKSIPTTNNEAINSLQIQPSTPPNSPTPPKNPNAKINPAHGQPGHKCEVAVGDPLQE
jgi:hypothetical protein